MNEVMISLRQLTMAFGSKVVLDELDLDVYKGETLAVIGPSGSGKSTVIKGLQVCLRRHRAACRLKDRRQAALTTTRGMSCAAIWALFFSIRRSSIF